jgi:hypothetical protein
MKYHYTINQPFSLLCFWTLDAGDHYLRPYVISKPEVTVTKRTDKDEFLVLASDGLWDVISNEVACQVVKRCLDGRMRRNSVEIENESGAAQAAAVLAKLAMARGCKDKTHKRDCSWFKETQRLSQSSRYLHWVLLACCEVVLLKSWTHVQEIKLNNVYCFFGKGMREKNSYN